MLFGTARAGRGVKLPRKITKKSRAPVVVLAAPSGITAPYIQNPQWRQNLWEDASTYGSAIGGRRDVFLRTKRPLDFQGGRRGDGGAMTLSRQYRRMEGESGADPDGEKRNYPNP